MVSDDERRAVAQKLRNEVECHKYDLNDDPDYSPFVASNVLLSMFDRFPRYSDLLHLADLIDRPTCRNVSGHRDTFECSECRCKVELIAAVCNECGEIFRVPSMPKYCPSCGAEVVNDA